MNFFKKKSPLSRVKTPTVIQMESVESGAAALSIVLSYYKKFVPLEALRTICGVTRDGSKASQIIHGARQLGLEAQGHKKEIAELETVQVPFIIFWNFNHFVVVEGFDKHYFYINDPAVGPRKVSHAEFDESFTGIIIELKPSASFKKEGSPPSIIGALKGKLTGIKSGALYVFLATLALIVPGLGIPLLTEVFFDKILPQEASAGFFFIGICVIMLMAGSLNWLQRHVLLLLNAKLSIQLSSKFFWHILRLPIQFFQQRHPGEVSYRLSTSDLVIQALTGQIILALINLLFIIFYLLVMVQINWPITALILFLSSINLLVFLLINRSRTDAYQRLLQDYGKNIGTSVGVLRNIDSIKSLGTESDVFSRWAGYFTKGSLSLQEINKKDIFLTSLPPLLQMITIAVFLSVGSFEVINGTLSIGILMGMQVLILNFLTPFNQFMNLGQVAQEVKANLIRIDDVMTNHEDPLFDKNSPEKIVPDEPIRLEGSLEVANLTFGFDVQSPPFIQDLSFKVEREKTLAFVGPTGSGKSTITKLLSSLYLPWSGTILLDKKDVQSLSRTLVVRSLATVDQSFFIFEGTFKDNITLWDTTIDEEELIKAAKDACIHDDILSVPLGYNAMILEGGKNLSGGQKQRIEIARALVRNPSILILDEATASLDSTTEHQIMRNIKRRGISVLFIAHRLSTIKDCDEIIVLDKGTIVQKGTHEELKREKGIYQDLVESQGI